MPRGRPRKIPVVEPPKKTGDYHSETLNPPGETRIQVGDHCAWTCGHELFNIYVRRRDVSENGKVWIYGSSAADSNEITMIVPETECRRRRALSA